MQEERDTVAERRGECNMPDRESDALLAVGATGTQEANVKTLPCLNYSLHVLSEKIRTKTLQSLRRYIIQRLYYHRNIEIYKYRCLDAHAASLLDELKERERAHLAQTQHTQKQIRAQLIHFEPLYLPATPASYPNALRTIPHASHTLSNATPVQDYKDTTMKEEEMYQHKKGKTEALVLQRLYGGQSSGVLPIPT